MFIECEKCKKIVAKHTETCRATINVDNVASKSDFQEKNIKLPRTQDSCLHSQKLSKKYKTCLEELIDSNENNDINESSENHNSYKANGLKPKRKRLHFPLTSDDSDSDDDLLSVSKEDLVSEIKFLSLIVKKLRRDNMKLKEKNLRLQEGLPLAICQLKEIALQLKSDKKGKPVSENNGNHVEVTSEVPHISSVPVLAEIQSSSSSSSFSATSTPAEMDVVIDLPSQSDTMKPATTSPLTDNFNLELSQQSLAPVDLGHGIIIDARHLERIHQATDYKKLICHMMDIMFARQELVTSSVSGKASNVYKDATAKPPLDPYRVNALINYVLYKFPGTKPSDIKQKISQKLRDTRKLDKGKINQSIQRLCYKYFETTTQD